MGDISIRGKSPILRQGFAKGGRAGFSMAGKVVRDAKKVFKRITHEVPTGPHTDVRRRELNKKFRRKEAAKGGRIGLKKGGSDKKWMQKVNKSIKKRGTKGKCTPITKPGCTGRAKALAKTFKKIAAKNKKA